MKTIVASILLSCTAVAQAITLSADPYPAGPAQPSSCTWNGVPGIPCILRRAPDGSVTPAGDATGLPTGTYIITLTVSNAASGVCTGGPAAFTCDSGMGPSTSAPISLVITRTGAVPGTPVVHVTAP